MRYRLHPLFKKDDGGEGGEMPAWASKLKDQNEEILGFLKSKKDPEPPSKDPQPEENKEKAQVIPQPQPPVTESPQPEPGASSQTSTSSSPDKKRSLWDFLR